MPKIENSKLLLFTFRRSITHRQSWPKVFANKDSYIAPTFASTEEHTANYIKTEKNNCHTIRPLLPLKRFETGKICMFWRLPIYPDLSNQKFKFLRNRLRKQLLPTLKVFFNPQIENVLLQFAEIIDIENCYINQTTTQLIKTFFEPNKNDFAKAFVTLKGDAKPLHASFWGYQVDKGTSSRLPKGSTREARGSKDSNCDKFPALLTTFVHLPTLPYKKNWFWRSRKKAKKNESFLNSKREKITKQSKKLDINFLQTSYSTNIVAFKKINTSSLVDRFSLLTLYGVSRLSSCPFLPQSVQPTVYTPTYPEGVHAFFDESRLDKVQGTTDDLYPSEVKGTCFAKKTAGQKFFCVKDLQNTSMCPFGVSEVEKKNRNWFTTRRIVDNTLSFSVPLRLLSQRSNNNVSQNFLKTSLAFHSVSKNTKLTDRKYLKICRFFEKLLVANIETKLDTTHYTFGSSYHPGTSRVPVFFLPLRGTVSRLGQNFLGLRRFHLKRAQVRETRTLPAQIRGIKKAHNLHSLVFPYPRKVSEILTKKNGLFRSKNKKKDSSNVENFNPSNLFCRFSMPIRATYWLWNRKVSRKSRWNNSSKTEIECALLSMFSPSVIQLRRPIAANYGKSFTFQGFQLGKFYETKERPRPSTENPKLLYLEGVEGHSECKSLGCNQRLLEDKLGVRKNCKTPNLPHYPLNTSFYPPASFLSSNLDCTPNSVQATRNQPMYLISKKSNNHKLLRKIKKEPKGVSHVDQFLGVKQANRLAIVDHKNSKLAKRSKKSSTKLFICKDFAFDLTTTPKNLLFGNSYSRKMNDIFATNFFIYFETLEMEKKEIYWPIVMSFFPIALQRRVVKFFLLNRNWKKIRYSHIETFLEKKKRSNSV